MLTDGQTDGLTDGLTDGQKIGRLYRTLLQAGAIKRALSVAMCLTPYLHSSRLSTLFLSIHVKSADIFLYISTKTNIVLLIRSASLRDSAE